MILIVSSVTGDARRSECFGSDPGSGIGVLFGRNGHPPARALCVHMCIRAERALGLLRLCPHAFLLGLSWVAVSCGVMQHVSPGGTPAVYRTSEPTYGP